LNVESGSPGEGGLSREQRRDLSQAKRTPRRQAAWVVLDGGCTKFPCVLWDISDAGARIAAAHGGALPDVFGLFLTKDGKSRRFCNVVWRRGGQIGVRLVDDEFANIDLDPTPAWMRRKPAGSYLPTAKNAAPSAAVDPSELLQPGLGPLLSSDLKTRSLRVSSIACGILFLLVAATVVFIAAGIQYEADWSVRLCTGAENFCGHPEWTGGAAIAMFFIFLSLRGMED
jgi:hypothetical protein